MKLILNGMLEYLPEARKKTYGGHVATYVGHPLYPDMASNLGIKCIESGINPNCFIPA